MRQIKIENWQQYGDYMFFANIVSANKDKVILCTSGNWIMVMGSTEGVEEFKIELKKRKVKFSE